MVVQHIGYAMALFLTGGPGHCRQGLLALLGSEHNLPSSGSAVTRCSPLDIMTAALCM